jgi:hypothetical protein
VEVAASGFGRQVARSDHFLVAENRPRSICLPSGPGVLPIKKNSEDERCRRPPAMRGNEAGNRELQTQGARSATFPLGRPPLSGTIDGQIRQFAGK